MGDASPSCSFLTRRSSTLLNASDACLEDDILLDTMYIERAAKLHALVTPLCHSCYCSQLTVLVRSEATLDEFEANKERVYSYCRPAAYNTAKLPVVMGDELDISSTQYAIDIVEEGYRFGILKGTDGSFHAMSKL